MIQGHTVNVKPAPEPAAPEAFAALPGPSGTTSLPASIVNASPVTPQLGAAQFVPAQSQGVVPGRLIKRVLPLYPDNLKKQIWLDQKWWTTNGAEIGERWNKWMLSKA